MRVPGMQNAASQGDDGSSGMNGLPSGDSGANGGGYGGGGGYGQGGSDYGGGSGEGSASGAGGDGGNGNGHGHGPGDGSGDDGRPKQKKLALACHFCRRRKLKCDGQRPTCDNCSKRGETCSYDDTVRRRGPGKRTKEIRQRAQEQEAASTTSTILGPSFGIIDTQAGPSGEPDMGDIGDLPATTDDLPDPNAHPSSVLQTPLPDIDPMIDPALAMIGMGGEAPATLAEAEPKVRGRKRKSEGTGEPGKKLKAEDEHFGGFEGAPGGEETYV